MHARTGIRGYNQQKVTTNSPLLPDPLSLGTYIQPITLGHTAAAYINICALRNMLFAQTDDGPTRGLGQLACLVQHDPNPNPVDISPDPAGSASTCNIQNTVWSKVEHHCYLIRMVTFRQRSRYNSWVVRGSNPRRSKRIFFRTSILTLGPTRPPMQWVPGFFARGTPLLPLYALMARGKTKFRDQVH